MTVVTSIAPAKDEVDRLLGGAHHDPHSVLGAHAHPGGTVVRALRTGARSVSVLVGDKRFELDPVEGGLFAGLVPEMPSDYRYEVDYGDSNVVIADDPYRWLPTVGELDLRHALSGWGCGVAARGEPDRQPRYGPRLKRASALDAFRGYLEERLSAGVWNAAVLLRELRERGYAGGYTVLKDYLQPKREASRLTAVRRFETPPGRQAQVDWGHLGTLEMDGKKHTIWVTDSDVTPALDALVRRLKEANTETLCQKEIGMDFEEAKRQLTAAGYKVRLVSKDGVSFPRTDDWREDRINLSVEKGKVVEARGG